MASQKRKAQLSLVGKTVDRILSDDGLYSITEPVESLPALKADVMRHVADNGKLDWVPGAINAAHEALTANHVVVEKREVRLAMSDIFWGE